MSGVTDLGKHRDLARRIKARREAVLSFTFEEVEELASMISLGLDRTDPDDVVYEEMKGHLDRLNNALESAERAWSEPGDAEFLLAQRIHAACISYAMGIKSMDYTMKRYVAGEESLPLPVLLARLWFSSYANR